MPTFDTKFADRFSAEAMPPTLFKLPDLARRNASAPTAKPSPASAASKSALPSSSAAALASAMPSTATAAAAAASNLASIAAHAPTTWPQIPDSPQAAPQSAVSEPPTMPEPVSQKVMEASVSSETSTTTMSPGEMPAGETANLAAESMPIQTVAVGSSASATMLAGVSGLIVANKTIVGLLICVVSAAWWSGQPNHREIGQTDGVALAVDTSTSVPNFEDESTIEIELGLPAEFQIDSQSLDQSIIASLNVPSATTQMAAAPTFSGGVPVHAVASRTANPLMDALADMANATDHGIGPNANVAPAVSPNPESSPYHFSRTPNGIDDWSQFLPPLNQ